VFVIHCGIGAVSVSEIQFLTVEQWDLVMFFGDGFGGWFHATIVYL